MELVNGHWLNIHDLNDNYSVVCTQELINYLLTVLISNLIKLEMLTVFVDDQPPNKHRHASNFELNYR